MPLPQHFGIYFLVRQHAFEGVVTVEEPMCEEWGHLVRFSMSGLCEYYVFCLKRKVVLPTSHSDVNLNLALRRGGYTDA
jgi:hypothetical protein